MCIYIGIHLYINQKTNKPKNHDQLTQPGIPTGHIWLGGYLLLWFFDFCFVLS